MNKKNMSNLFNKIRMGTTTEPTNSKKCWQIKNISTGRGEVLIYGDIEEYRWMEEDVTAYNFSKELKSLGDVTEIDVRINSGGGSVFAAQAIYSQLKAHVANVNVYVDGLAASAASLIAMAGDSIKMPANAMMMIHNPMTIAVGDVKDFAKTMDTLGKVKDSILATYEAKTGLSYEELSQMMDDETWLTGAEAVEKGFADELLHSVEVTASLKGKQLIVNSVKHDLSAFKKKPTFPNDEQETQNSFKEMMAEFFNMFKISNQTVADKKVNQGKEEEENLKTLEELKNKYPDLYNQVIQEGAKVENARIQEIDDYTEPGFENVMNEAKSDPTITVAQAVMNQTKAMKEARNQQNANAQNQAKKYLENRTKDSAVVNEIEGDSAPENNSNEKAEEDEVINAMAAFVNKKRGGNR